MPERARMLDEPGPFALIAEASGKDVHLLGLEAWEEALVLCEVTGGQPYAPLGTVGEQRLAALQLAATALAVYAALGSAAPLAALRAHARDRAKLSEQVTL